MLALLAAAGINLKMETQYREDESRLNDEEDQVQDEDYYPPC